MFLPKLGRDPYYNGGLYPGRVSDELPQMIVVSSLELIFDDNFTITRQVVSHNIDGEAADTDLAPALFEFQTNGFTELLEIIGKPSRKVRRLKPPDLPNRYL